MHVVNFDACWLAETGLLKSELLHSCPSSRAKFNLEEFALGNVIDAIVSQVMVLLKEKNLQLIHDIPDQIKTLFVYGDQIKLQLILSDFLVSMVHHTPSPDGWVEIKVSPGLKLIQDGHEYIHLQFRYQTIYFIFLLKSFNAHTIQFLIMQVIFSLC